MKIIFQPDYYQNLIILIIFILLSLILQNCKILYYIIIITTTSLKQKVNQQMKLDASYLHFISKQQLRILTAIQLGMRNHQYVPAQLIARIGKLRGGQTFKIISKLLKNKFITHINKKYDGYKLTYLGYDYLALQTFIKRGVIKDVISKIGVGKQSDVYKCITPDGEMVVLKLTRLGRNSFRSIKKNRQYIQHRTNYNWLYLSRLSSIRQFLFMQLLYQNDFVTPKPIDTNRHAIVMSLVEGDTLCHIQRISTQQEVERLFVMALQMIIKLAKNGLVHGDFNEFNLITNDSGTKLTVIDFPQCISRGHFNANNYFNRDVECIYTYFDKMSQRTFNDSQKNQKQQGDMQKNKRFNVSNYPMPVLSQIPIQKRLDHELKTKGHITLSEQKQLQQLQQYRAQQRENKLNQDDQSDEDSEYSEEKIEQEQQDSFQAQKQDETQQEKIKRNFQNLENELEKIDMKFQIQPTQNHLIQLKNNLNQKDNQQNYDKELQNLMKELESNNLTPTFQQQKLLEVQNSDDQQQQQQERPQFKGLTAFQIRLKLKEQKKLQRQKKKQLMSQSEYIKNALKKGPKKNTNSSKLGNHGYKKKSKSNSQAIKDGFQLM